MGMLRTRAAQALALALIPTGFGAGARAETPVITPQDVSPGSGGTICFYVDSPHLRLTGPYKSIRTGHAFAGLQPDSGPQQGNGGMVYGHVPTQGLNPFSEAGKTEGQADHPWDYRICYHVGADQYNAAAKFIRGEISSPSDFHLFGRNCTDWIDRLADAAHIQIPRTTDPSSPHVKDPSVFEDNLAAVGPGRSFEGGLVRRQAVTSLASQFDRDSVKGLGTASVAAPQMLASGLKYEFTNRSLPPVKLAPGQSISLALPTETALSAVGFDPATTVVNQGKVVRRYPSAGTFPVQVSIIRPGRLYSFRFSVVVAGKGEPVTRPVAIPPTP